MRLRADGWFSGVHRRPSPNQDARPEGVAVDLLVLHCIALPPRHYGGPGVYQLFANTLDPRAHPYYAQIAELRVSAHLWLRRSGAVVQFVGLEQRAWHAGVSQWQGRERCNDYSIGIELEGRDDGPYTAAQYRQLARLTRQIQRAYPGIGAERIVAHSDIAPGRKTDPGPGFDWGRLRRLLGPPGTVPPEAAAT